MQRHLVCRNLWVYMLSYDFKLLQLFPHSTIHCRRQFGSDVMEIEYGKKENRSEAGHTLTMAEFLDVSVCCW